MRRSPLKFSQTAVPHGTFSLPNLSGYATHAFSKLVVASDLIPLSPQKGNRQGRKERQELMKPFEEVPVGHLDLGSVI